MQGLCTVSDHVGSKFNLVLHPEARFAAEDFHDRLKIPYIELRRLYQIDKIASQYRALAAALGVEFEDEIPRKAAEEAVENSGKYIRMQYLPSENG